MSRTGSCRSVPDAARAAATYAQELRRRGVQDPDHCRRLIARCAKRRRPLASANAGARSPYGAAEAVRARAVELNAQGLISDTELRWVEEAIPRTSTDGSRAQATQAANHYVGRESTQSSSAGGCRVRLRAKSHGRRQRIPTVVPPLRPRSPRKEMPTRTTPLSSDVLPVTIVVPGRVGRQPRATKRCHVRDRLRRRRRSTTLGPMPIAFDHRRHTSPSRPRAAQPALTAPSLAGAELTELAPTAHATNSRS